MSAEQIQEGKVIGNIGVLDLRNSTEESVARIRRIGNVGMIIHSPETTRFISMLNIGNIGGTLEVPDGAQLLSGKVSLNFKDASQPLKIVAMGKIFIEADATVEDVEKNVDYLACSGKILCPQHLLGVVQSKAKDISGKLIPYPSSAQLYQGKLVLNDDILNGLEDDSELCIIGQLDMPDIVDNTLLARKVRRVHVLGEISCREENISTLSERLEQRYGTPKISTIPLGFTPVYKAIALDNAALISLPSRKLYCTGLVTIDPETDADALDKAIDALQTTRLLIAPAHLKDVLATKCNLLESKAIFYEGELWHITDEAELLLSRFDYLEGKATLVVRDHLTLAADIEPQVLADRLHKIHNLDTIACTPAQMGAVQARLGLNEGELVDSTTEEKEEEEEEGIGNVGHLAL